MSEKGERPIERHGILRSSIQPDVPVRYTLEMGHEKGLACSRGELHADGDALMIAALGERQSLVLQDGTVVAIAITLADGDGSGRFEIKGGRSWH